MVEYFGIFINEDNYEIILKNEKVHLEKVPKNFHCTFCFKPYNLDFFNKIIGTEVEIRLVGYACNGENSGFEVKLDKNYANFFKNYDENRKLKTPHITTSLSIEGKAKNTKDLKFEKLDREIVLKGRFGYFVKEKNNSCVIFDKIYNKELEK